MSQDPAVLIAMGPCVVHGGLFQFDPDRVTSMLWDPVTDNPPDVDPVTDQPVSPPDPERVARSYQAPVCPACCKRLNEAARAQGLPAQWDETDTSGGQVQR
jgi:hypothetical protein